MMIKVLFAAVLAALACTATAQVCSGDQCLGCAGGNVTVPLLQDCSINVGALDFTNVTNMLDVCTCQCSSAPVKCEVFTGPNAALNFAENSQNGPIGSFIGGVIGSIGGGFAGSFVTPGAGSLVGSALGNEVGQRLGDTIGDAIGK